MSFFQNDWNILLPRYEYGFPIIGGTHKNLASSGLVIDSSYMRIVYDYGFLFLVALLTMFTLLQKRQSCKETIG